MLDNTQGRVYNTALEKIMKSRKGKRDPVKKNMDRFHKPKRHKDLRKEYNRNKTRNKLGEDW